MNYRAVQFHPQFCPEARGFPSYSWDTPHDLSMLDEDGKRYRIGTFQTAELASWVGALLEDLGLEGLV